MTETSRNTALRWLRDELTLLLEDDLGRYQFSNNNNVIRTYPSIWVTPPELPSQYSFLAGSGCEVTIRKEGGMIVEPMLNKNHSIYEDFPIEIVQRNLEKAISPVIEKILSHRYWAIMKTPVVLGYQKTNTGFLFPQATVSLSIGYLLENDGDTVI